MVLTLVPEEDQVGTSMRGHKRLYRDKEQKKKDVAEKRRVERLIANAVFDEIEERNKQLEGKY